MNEENQKNILKVNSWFKPIEEGIKIVLKSDRIHSIFIQSRGGLSKTTTTLNTLKEEGKEFEHISNYGTPVELINFFYTNRNKIIILDDFETIWGLGTKGINILKGALWGSGKENTRTIGYLTTSKLLKAPSKFEFKGKLIILLNKIPEKQNRLVKALLSRALVYEMDLNYKETMELLFDFSKLDYPMVSYEKREEIYNYLKQNTDSSNLEDLNFRTLIKLYEVYKVKKDTWREFLPMVLSRNERLILLKKFLQKTRSVKDAQELWSKEFGLSRRQFFREKRKIS